MTPILLTSGKGFRVDDRCASGCCRSVRAVVTVRFDGELNVVETLAEVEEEDQSELLTTDERKDSCLEGERGNMWYNAETSKVQSLNDYRTRTQPHLLHTAEAIYRRIHSSISRSK